MFLDRVPDCMRRRGTIVGSFVLAAVLLVPGPTLAGPSYDIASCGGEAPLVLECRTTSVIDTDDIGVGLWRSSSVPPLGFHGRATLKLTGPTGEMRAECISSLPHVNCTPFSKEGYFSAGQAVRLEGHALGIGLWSVRLYGFSS